MRLATPISMERMCGLAGVSRAGYYRWRQAAPAVGHDPDLRDEMQKVALEFPAYGRRRITAELGQRGWKVNRKRVQRIMREDNLLCLRRRKFVATTDSRHDLPVYRNLAQGLVLTDVDQLWIADVTYSTPSQRSPPAWG
jgi:putative transposase